MLISFNKFLKNLWLLKFTGQKNTFCLKSLNDFSKMNEPKIPRTKYDGRSKKRQWEERRTDKGESLGIKQPKLDKSKVEDVPADKIIDKIKRRKFVLLMGYSGVGYWGMQRNPHTKTIEEELFKALKNVGLINSIDFGQVQNLSFQRAARTDKGVSAARQVVSLKLPENLNIERINNELPDEIIVFDCKRVTKGFNSKSQCDSRTYTYMMPTIAFSNKNDVDQKAFRMNSEIFTKVNEILKQYVGTKNYHNYTSKKKFNDPSASRFMKSFICEEPFVRRDVEFAVLKVQGQSFMMHQIRKMIGALLAIVRGHAPEEVIKNSFCNEKVCIPRAPGLGLVLDYVHYDRYNFRYGEDGMHEKLTWETVEDKVNEFKEKYIYPTIINTEVEKESMLWWLQNKLSKHSYDDADNYESDDENLEDDDDDDNKRNESPDKIIEVEKTTESSNMNENINKPTASF